MSAKKVTTRTLRLMKNKGEKITALTAYDHPSAVILDGAGVELILVGDSAANVVLGYDSTLPVSMEEMLMLTAAVVRGTRRALVVADMPFMSYQISSEQALTNAGRFIKEAGAEAIKLEGGQRSLAAITRIVEAGIPVMGHIGLTPQSYLQYGGYRVQGRKPSAAEALLADAKALEGAGAFAMVLEGIPWSLAGEISDAVGIPTIGIGAGQGCDGQILVLHDMLGFGTGEFKFVKRYDDLDQRIRDAVTTYCREVKSGAFPDEQHRFESKGDRGDGGDPERVGR